MSILLTQSCSLDDETVFKVCSRFSSMVRRVSISLFKSAMECIPSRWEYFATNIKNMLNTILRFLSIKSKVGNGVQSLKFLFTYLSLVLSTFLYKLSDAYWRCCTWRWCWPQLLFILSKATQWCINFIWILYSNTRYIYPNIISYK